MSLLNSSEAGDTRWGNFTSQIKGSEMSSPHICRDARGAVNLHRFLDVLHLRACKYDVIKPERVDPQQRALPLVSRVKSWLAVRGGLCLMTHSMLIQQRRPACCRVAGLTAAPWGMTPTQISLEGEQVAAGAIFEAPVKRSLLRG